MSTHLQKITAKAKQLRKQHPNMKWTSLIKMAAKKVKPAAKKRSAPKKRKARVGAYKVIEKRESRSAKPSAVYRVNRTKKGTVKSVNRVAGVPNTVAGMMGAARRILVEEVGRLEARKFIATTKRDKGKIQKIISQKKSQLRRLAK